MAKSLKTVQYCFPILASLTDNTLTALTTITILLPDIYSGASSIKKVIATLSADDIITATGGTISITRMQLGLGGGAKTNISNTTIRTNTAENVSVFHTFDFTSRFTTSWSGTSMTCEANVLIDQSTGTSLGMVNVCVSLDITYEYEDTSAIQVKTVWIPLTTLTGSCAFPTKSSIPESLIPNLETYCPEDSKIWLQNSLWLHSNTSITGPANHTLSFQINTGSVVTSSAIINALTTDRFHRYINTTIFDSMDKNAVNQFYIWITATSVVTGREYHPQLWIQSTYQFSASTSTSSLVSLILPYTTNNRGIQGYNSYDHLKTIDFYIPEDDPKLRSFAFYGLFSAIQAPNNFYFQYHNKYSNSTTGLYDIIPFIGSVFAGPLCFGPVTTGSSNNLSSSNLQIRKGLNTFMFSFYKPSSSLLYLGKNFSGFCILNYTATIPSSGIGSMNRTVFYNVMAMDGLTGTSYFTKTLDSGIIPIPESKHYINSFGSRMLSFNDIIQSKFVTFDVVEPENTGSDMVSTDVGKFFINTDLEMGGEYQFYECTDYPKFPNQYSALLYPTKTFISSSNVLGLIMSYEQNNSTTLRDLTLLCTYHTMNWPVTGTIAGSNGGTIYLHLIRDFDKQILSQTTVSGNGNFYFDWYDNTEKVFVEAYEDDTHVGRSKSGYAGT